MRNAMQIWKLVQPLLKRPTSSNYFNIEVLKQWRQPRKKVLFIMGVTGTGKSRLSINLATLFTAEIINSDKIQIYKGLDIVTNKVTKEEQCGIPHHLLGIVNPDVDFTAKDFCIVATQAVEAIHNKGKLPIIVGGSNSYIETLVSDPKYGFGSKYDCCFLWVDVCMPVLKTFVSDRVDKMVDVGFVDEVRGIFDPNNSDYSKGILRAIGVPELDPYFRAEPVLNKPARARELKRAIDKIKFNTFELASRQLEKIQCLKHVKGWDLHRIDATEVFRKYSDVGADDAWEKHVTNPASKIVKYFLKHDHSFGSGLQYDYSMITSNNQPWFITSI